MALDFIKFFLLVTIPFLLITGIINSIVYFLLKKKKHQNSMPKLTWLATLNCLLLLTPALAIGFVFSIILILLDPYPEWFLKTIMLPVSNLTHGFIAGYLLIFSQYYLFSKLRFSWESKPPIYSLITISILAFLLPNNYLENNTLRDALITIGFIIGIHLPRVDIHKYDTSINICDSCKGSGRIQKYKKNGEPYKRLSICPECN